MENSGLTQKYQESIADHIRDISEIGPRRDNRVDDTQFTDMFGESIPNMEMVMTPQQQKKRNSTITNKIEGENKGNLFNLEQEKSYTLGGQSDQKNEFLAATFKPNNQNDQFNLIENFKVTTQEDEDQGSKNELKLNEEQQIQQDFQNLKNLKSNLPIYKGFQQEQVPAVQKKQDFSKILSQVVKSTQNLEKNINKLQEKIILEVKEVQQVEIQFNKVLKVNEHLINKYSTSYEPELLEKVFNQTLKEQLVFIVNDFDSKTIENHQLQKKVQQQQTQLYQMRKTLDDFQLQKNKNIKEISRLNTELGQLKALRKTDQNYFDQEFNKSHQVNNQNNNFNADLRTSLPSKTQQMYTPQIQEQNFSATQLVQGSHQKVEKKYFHTGGDRKKNNFIEENGKQETHQNANNIVKEDIENQLKLQQLWMVDKEKYADMLLYGQDKIDLKKNNSLKKLPQIDNKQQNKDQLKKETNAPGRGLDYNIFEIAKNNKDHFLKHWKAQANSEQMQKVDKQLTQQKEKFLKERENIQNKK